MKKNTIIGTAQFGLNYGISNKTGIVSIKEISEILQTAANAGINTLDTAISYGDCDKKLGEIGVKHWNIISKISTNTFVNKQHFNDQISNILNTSLKNLKKKDIYCLLIHDSESFISNNQSYVIDLLKRLKELKIIKKYGFSVYQENELEIILDKYNPDIIQAPLNLFDKRFVSNKFIEVYKSRKIEFHARSIFLQGLLLMDDKIPRQFKKWKHLFDQLDSFCDKNNISRFQACVQFINHCKNVNNIIIGVQSKKQLEQYLNEMNSSSIGVFPQFELSDNSILNPSLWNSL